MRIVERLPVLGRQVREQNELLESQRSQLMYDKQFMAELAEEVKDWKALAAQTNEKDVDWNDYVANHKDCWAAYVENPLAKGYIDRMTDFVASDGFTISSTKKDDGAHQKELDALWDEDEWWEVCVQVCRELGIYGEVFWRWFGDNGVLLDPTIVKDIITNPENVKDVRSYKLEYSVDNRPIEKNIPAGGIEHQKSNTVSTAKRGISDLLCVLKWLTRHKEVATNLVRRTNLQMSVIGIKRIKGPGVSSTTVGGWKKDGDDATSSETAKRKERMPKPGTWFVATPQVDYEFFPLPNDTRGMVDLLKMLNKMICAGLGLSEHWLGDTSESNLATATSMELPILAKFKRRQREITKLLRVLCDKKGATDYEIIPPELSEEDEVQFATYIKTLCEGLVLAVDNRWISDETASKTIGDGLDFYESFQDERKTQEKLDAEDAKKKADLAKTKQDLGIAPTFGQPGAPPVATQPLIPSPQPPPPGLPNSNAQQIAASVVIEATNFQRKYMDEHLSEYKDALEKVFGKTRKSVAKFAKARAKERSGVQAKP